jgi:hypothetical protein
VRRTLPIAVALVLAGCGGEARQTRTQPPPPKLPRALAHSWSTQADMVASALAAGDGCTALHDAEQLRTEVGRSIGRVAARYRAALTAAVADLPSRITCNPPAPPPAAHDNGTGKDHHGKHKGREGHEG